MGELRALLHVVTWLAKKTHYVSTYCMHDEHGTCRLKCKGCGKKCRCWCHRPIRSFVVRKTHSIVAS